MNTHPLLRRGIILVLLFYVVARVAFAGPSPLVVVRSGNGALDGTDSQITYEPGPNWNGPFPYKFTAADFAAASNGSAPWIIYPDAPWTQQLDGDTISEWVAPLPGFTEYNGADSPTALYAVRFNMPSVPSVVTLVMHYCADNQLGDSINNALYLNGTAVPGTNYQVGTYNSESVITVPNVAALLKTGSNILYLNDVNTGGPSGMFFRADFYAGNYNWSNYAGAPGITGTVNAAGSAAQFTQPGGIAVDGSGNAFVADTANDTVREIAPGGIVSPLAGVPDVSGTSDGTGTSAQFASPGGIAVDGNENVYVADEGNDTIREIAPGGVVTTIAGSAGITGTANATGTAASFNSPAAVAVDRSGNVYVADEGNDTIREIASGGAVTTIAGTAGITGTANASGTSAGQFNAPSGIAVDGQGNIYIADTGNHTIREIPNGGQLTTIAGTPGIAGTADGYQSAAQFSGPNGLSVDHNGDLFIADGPADTIREMTPDGTVATIGGAAQTSGTAGGLGAAARFDDPQSVAVDFNGNLYVADTQNDRIATSAPTAPPFALIAPVSNSTQNAPLVVSYSLPSQAQGGSVKLTFDNGGTPTVVTLASAAEAPGANTIDFDPTDPHDSPIVASVTGTTHNSGSTPYIPPGVYTVTLSYQDQYGDPVQSASSTNVQIYNQAVPSLTLPAANSTICWPVVVLYSLPGRALAGSVSLVFSGTGSPIFYGINSNGENEGLTNFAFDPTNPGGSGDIVSSSTTPLPIGVYTVTLAYQDYAGDPAASVSNTNVYFAPVATVAATNVDSYSAQLNGQALSSFFGSGTSVMIESGTSTSYGASAPVLVSGSNNSGMSLYANVTGLSRDTTYHFQIVMVNNGVTYYGGDQTFTTTHDDSPSVPSPLVFDVPMLTKPITLDVLAQATPGNPTDTLSVTSVGAAAEGTVAINGSGASVTYTPARFNGNDSFNLVIGDNFGGSTSTTVELEDLYPSFAGSYQGLVSGSAQGYLSVTLGAGGTFTGSLRLGAGTYAFKGTLVPTDSATITIPRKGLPSVTLTLSLGPNDNYGTGSFNYSVSIPGAGVEQGNFNAKSIYSSSFPAPNAGTYTMVINPPGLGGTAQAIVTGTSVDGKITAIDVVDGGSGYDTAPTFTITGGDGKGAEAVALLSSTGSIASVQVVKPGSNYTNPVTVTVGVPSGLPQGYGWATMKISNLGAVSIVGKLADGARFTSGGWVNDIIDGEFNPAAYTQPYILLYSALYGPKATGYLTGTLYFNDYSPPTIQFQTSSLTWYKPPQMTPQLYKNGFDVSVDLNGSLYAAPVKTYPIALDSGTGNAIITLTDGVSGLNLENNVTIPPTPATASVFVSGSEDAVKITTNPATGVFTGKFTLPGTKHSAPISGVYLQQDDAAYGFFTGTNESGSVQITPGP